MELFIEIDYQTIRQALLAAYIITIIFPIVAVFFLNKQNRWLSNKYHATVQSIESVTVKFDCCFMDFRGFQRFFTTVRQKCGPDDSEEPPSFSLCI